MEPEPAPAPEVTQTLEHDVVIEENEHTKYPAALASHETVLEDKQLFLGLLQDLCTKLQDAEPKKFRPTKFRIPTAAGQDLDLQRLYRCATQLGGAVSVTEQHRWPDVIRPMNFPSKVNTAAIRKIYSQLLWHFERVYFQNAAGQPIMEPPELAVASAAAAAVQAAAADRQTPSSAGMANGAGRGRPARSRKGPSLAALIAAEDQISSGLEDGDGAGDQEDSQSISDGAAGSEDQGDDSAAAAAPASAAPAPAVVEGTPPAAIKKPEAAALLAAAAPAAAASPGRGSAPPAAPGNGAAPAAGGSQQAKPRSRPQQRSSAAAHGKTPELTAFMKAGRHRRDLTGASVTGKVEARFDCGYFVSINVGGLQFGGVLYCPTGTGGSTGQGQASRAAVKREDGAAPGGDGAVGGSRKPPSGAGIKREAGAAGLEAEGAGGGGGGGGSRATKRRRSMRDVNDPALANKPKSAKTAFNFFAAEQWANLRSELGSNAAPQDISRMIGERWNKTSEEERAPYTAKAVEDKGRFEREMGTWRSGLEAAAAAADSAGVPADAEAQATAGASTSPAAGDAADVMDVDTAAAAAPAVATAGPAAVAVKPEQRSATPPRPLQPRLKLKMSGGNSSRHTPPPAAPAAAEAPVVAAAAAAAHPAVPAAGAAVGSEADAAFGAAAEGQQQPVINPAAAEPGVVTAVHQFPQDAPEQQQQHQHQQPPCMGVVVPERTTAAAVPPPPPPPPAAVEAAAEPGMVAAEEPGPGIGQDGMVLDAPYAQQ